MTNAAITTFGPNAKGAYKLRPHHACNIVAFRAKPRYLSMPDADFIAVCRKACPSNVRPDGFVLGYRALMRKLLETPEAKIEIVHGSDQVCGKCPSDSACNSPELAGRSGAHEADAWWLKHTPDIKVGKTYTAGEILGFGEKMNSRSGRTRGRIKALQSGGG